MTEINAVVFDYFGTLTPSTPSRIWDEHAARSAAPLGIAPRTWRAALDQSFGERITGRLGDLPATFRELAARCGVSPDPAAIAAACAERRAAQRELFVLRSDAIGVLSRLHEMGLRLGVLSDCTIELAEQWPQLPAAGLVDTRVLSCEEGRRKPDRALFDAITQRLAVPASRCLYVGDGGGQELTGAIRYGMRAVLLRAGDWSVNVAHEREDGWPGEVITSLLAVPGLIPS